MEFSYKLKIPKDRIAILIGKKGKVKKDIERATKTKVIIDSEEGEVTIQGDDALGLYTAREIVKAICRGFNPEIAMLLLKGDYAFDLVDIGDYAKTKKDLVRLKGRVIGEGGKSRRHIEDLTNTNIVVYGKTIGIIGKAEDVVIARKAVVGLLEGSKHTTVYRMIERKRREAKYLI